MNEFPVFARGDHGQRTLADTPVDSPLSEANRCRGDACRMCRRAVPVLYSGLCLPCWGKKYGRVWPRCDSALSPEPIPPGSYTVAQAAKLLKKTEGGIHQAIRRLGLKLPKIPAPSQGPAKLILDEKVVELLRDKMRGRGQSSGKRGPKK